jgi:hypothetical protein
MLSISGDKYEAVSTDNDYKKYMMLKIRSVKHNDFGSYKCVAKNSLGETDGIIKLDGELTVSIPEECRLLGCDAVWLLIAPTFRRNISP